MRSCRPCEQSEAIQRAASAANINGKAEPKSWIASASMASQ